ncbi:MAG: hypothetical protein GC161_02145 [Planctomycetaceae bacterium]|nr:hypothetical protein [Planctomycetaceae bacterium]
MDLHIDWTRPIPVRRVRSATLEFAIDLEAIPPEPGIYLFGRRHGTSFEALYVGKASRLRARIRQHLNNRSLLNHLADAATGKRILLAGVLTGRQGQQLPKALALAEKALLRHFLSEGHDLINKQGTKIRSHTLHSTGRHPKRLFPRAIHLEQ